MKTARTLAYVVSLVASLLWISSAAGETISLTSGVTGSIFGSQSYNETRAVDVTVLSGEDLRVSSMTLSGLRVSRIDTPSPIIGARIYDSSGKLVASANVPAQISYDPFSVTIPISAILSAGASYRIGAFVGVGGFGGAGDLFYPDSLPYSESTGLLRINGAYSIADDSYPTLDNIFLPQITLEATRVGPVATVPGAPQNVIAWTNENGTVTVTWEPPSSDGGSSITSYTIVPMLGNFEDVAPSVPVKDPNLRTGTLTGVVNGQPVMNHVLIYATNDVGDGPATDSAGPDCLSGGSCVFVTPLTNGSFSDGTNGWELFCQTFGGSRWPLDYCGNFYTTSSAGLTLDASETPYDAPYIGAEQTVAAPANSILQGTVTVHSMDTCNTDGAVSVDVSLLDVDRKSLGEILFTHHPYTTGCTPFIGPSSPTFYWEDMPTWVPGTVPQNFTMDIGWIIAQHLSGVDPAGKPSVDPAKVAFIRIRLLNYADFTRPSVTFGNLNLTARGKAIVPSAPRNVKAEAGANGTLIVTWEPPSNGGSPITRYTIVPMYGNFESDVPPDTAGANDTTKTLTGVVNGQPVMNHVLVYATNAVGNGPAADSAGPDCLSGGSCDFVEADLSITQTATPDSVGVGQKLTYTMTVTNNGPRTATGVIVTHTLTADDTLQEPAKVSWDLFTSSQGTACGRSDTTVTCNLDSLAEGGSATVTIVVTPTTPGKIYSTASVKGDVLPSDPTLPNESRIITTVRPKPEADLEVTQSISLEQVNDGRQKLIFTVRVTNNGPSTATGVIVNNSLVGTELVFFKPSDGFSCDGSRCILESLASGASATAVTIWGFLAKGKVVTTTNVARGSGNEMDLKQCNNMNQTTVLVSNGVIKQTLIKPTCPK